MHNKQVLVMGAVAYAPKVVTIWDGFKEYFSKNGLPFDYVLYSNYERQVEAMFEGGIHVAWNSPLAWIRAQRMAKARGLPMEAIVMRDTDCDLTSVVVVKSNSQIKTAKDLKGKRVAVGAIDSPQATLIPLEVLRQQGVVPHTDFSVLRFDVLGGKHGDHIGGERDAARALMEGQADAACMIDGNHLAFITEGTLPAGQTRVLLQTPAFDHCNFSVSPGAPADLIAQFKRMLLAMSYADAEIRPLLDLEGLKAWRTGRTEGYKLLDEAVNETNFYDADGNITIAGYRY
ncbi:MAG: phosphate/phosphite/phosphonate ABC transporter substrate-binding protein [Burkholderiales bacterium]